MRLQSDTKDTNYLINVESGYNIGKYYFNNYYWHKDINYEFVRKFHMFTKAYYL